MIFKQILIFIWLLFVLFNFSFWQNYNLWENLYNWQLIFNNDFSWTWKIEFWKTNNWFFFTKSNNFSWYWEYLNNKIKIYVEKMYWTDWFFILKTNWTTWDTYWLWGKIFLNKNKKWKLSYNVKNISGSINNYQIQFLYFSWNDLINAEYIQSWNYIISSWNNTNYLNNNFNNLKIFLDFWWFLQTWTNIFEIQDIFFGESEEYDANYIDWLTTDFFVYLFLIFNLIFFILLFKKIWDILRQ
jgi:hypothetical protein